MGEEQEDEIEEDNGTLLDGQDQQVEIRGYHQLPTASTVRHRTKTTKLGGKELRGAGSNALQQRNLNLDMTKMQRSNKSAKGGAVPKSRLETEAFLLKAEVDKANKERIELKRQLEELRNSQKGSHKRVKVVKRKVEAKPEIAGVWSELREAYKKDVHPSVKFLDHEKDECAVMLACLQKTNEWSALNHLTGEELEEEVKSYRATYGPKMTAWTNECRSQDQTSCRNVWIDLRNKGLLVTADQLLKVALRNPKHLLLLNENTGDQEVDAKNEEANQEKKRCRSRSHQALPHQIRPHLHPPSWLEHSVADPA